MVENFEKVKGILEANNLYVHLFDLVRLVDAERGKVLEYAQDNSLVSTDVCCTDMLGRDERCKNCTTIRAYYTNETVVKLEYADGKVLLVFSCPVEIEGRRVISELVKDITKSMMVNIEDEARDEEITGIIANLNEMATTDALTGLLNRRFFNEQLPSLLETSQIFQSPMSVAMLDLDDFKGVNDTHGHAAGDFVLASIGSIISANIRRGGDWAARYGGEEIFLCFPGTNISTARGILERIRMQVSNTTFNYEGLKIHITASIGLTQLRPNDDVSSLMNRCDKFLYKAKQNGKNRIESD